MGTQIPRIESCCCGCSIRSGTLIILWIYLFFSIVSPYVGITDIVYINDNADRTNVTTVREITAITTKDIVFRSPDAFDLIQGIIAVVVAGLGLYGVYKEISGYLLPFLVVDVILIILDFLSDIFLGFSIPVMISGFIVLLLEVYFWMVVYNHYRNIKDGNSSLVA